MESKSFSLENYITQGVESTVKELIFSVRTNPAESLFLAGFSAACKRAAEKRRRAAEAGEHIPAFLIASITSHCNLNCAGCYARANHACGDSEPEQQLTAKEWGNVFRQAEELGISFILLAGGEPLIRQDVIRAAGKHRSILFPVFTNGTMIGDIYAEIFRKYRNILPVLSIEGGREKTDLRRGRGVYDRLMQSMEVLRDSKIIFGASVTVTAENIGEVTSGEFRRELEEFGCRAVIYVEYVPADGESLELTLTDDQREQLRERVCQLRQRDPELVTLSFPGDENTSEGCLAAGRGFFHINSHGGAEPCPFSPYSDTNVRETSVREALRSGLFTALRSGDLLKDDHSGGCVLFEKREQVEALLNGLK